VALDVKGVADGGMAWEEFLSGVWALEALHLALASSGWLMRSRGPIILPSAGMMAVLNPELASGGAIRAQVVRDHPIWNEAIFLQEFAHRFQGGVPVSVGLYQHIEGLTLSIDRSPQIDHAASDF
jgi:hypothetical protein